MSCINTGLNFIGQYHILDNFQVSASYFTSSTINGGYVQV